MGAGILVVGESGTGKSTSIETLDPKETFIINIKGKPLPFKGFNKNYTIATKDNPDGNMVKTDKAAAILKTLSHISENMPHIKTVIIDDFQYMAAEEFMAKALEKGLN